MINNFEYKSKESSDEKVDRTIRLGHLDDQALTAKIKKLAAIERKLTQVMIQHIAEVDRRKLYLRRAYSSLYEYLTIEIGYSEGAAQRRIDAARLLRSVPELAQKIEQGSIKLSQVSYMQKVCRQIKKDSGQTISADVRHRLLNEIENKGISATQSIVAQALNLSVQTEEVVKKTYQADESVRVELTFSKAQMSLVTEAQELLSNTTGGGLKDTLLYLVENFLKSNRSDSQKSSQKEKPKGGGQLQVKNNDNDNLTKHFKCTTDGSGKVSDKDNYSFEGFINRESNSKNNKNKNKNNKNDNKNKNNSKNKNYSNMSGQFKSAIIKNNVSDLPDESSVKSTATVAVNSELNQYPNVTFESDDTNKNLTLKIKKEVRNRDRCCQFVDKKTGKICGSRHFLEVDHIQPRFAGGSHERCNLRLLCRNHNQFRYRSGL
ncbi:MAG: DUF222 domain-containing protein [Bdellovibrio sp.]|nr:DUF222 domain-containing protein [Bdellovibrio sp.]